MAPALTRFTSELFYDGQAAVRTTRLEAQVLRGTGRFDGSGLWLVPVMHDGNQNASAEEVDAVEALVASLLDHEWTLTPPVARDENGPPSPRAPVGSMLMV